MAVVKGLDPEPFNKKDWGLILGGTVIGALGFFVPAQFKIFLIPIFFFSIYMAFCGLHVLMVDPIGRTRWEKKGRDKLPKYFVIISSVVLLTLIVLYAIM